VSTEYGGPAAAIAAGWHHDPAGRNQYRYHDGTNWTDHVANDGVQGRDPLVAVPAPPPAPPWHASATGPGPTFAASTSPSPSPTVQQYGAPERDWPTEPTPPGGVDMGEAVERVLSKYADFKGRAPRSEYWWFVLAMWLALVTATVVGEMLIAIRGPDFVNLADAMLGLVVLGLLLPHLSVIARRLHDTDRSGWWALLMFVPLVGVIALIVLLASKGTDHPNRYGPALSS
jgi:uncharacterized membrane protein YhaH (DUF805 family)